MLAAGRARQVHLDRWRVTRRVVVRTQVFDLWPGAPEIEQFSQRHPDVYKRQGVVRSHSSLASTAAALAGLAAADDGVEGGPKSWETTNLLHLGQLLTHVATLREETRGGHVRSDFPDRDDAHWLGHLAAVRMPDGILAMSFHPTEPQDLS